MTLKILYDSFYADQHPLTQREFIGKYESNIVLINNFSRSFLPDYKYVMRLTCDYAITLSDLGYYKKSLQYLDKSIEMIQNYPGYTTLPLLNIPYFEAVMFKKAVVLYNLRKYKDSSIIFDQLNKAFPNNDKYVSWDIGTRNKKLDLYSRITFGIILLVWVLRTIFKGKNMIFDMISFWLVVVALIILISIEIIKKIKANKIRKINAT